MKFLDRVGKTSWFGFHGGNHNEEGNPHPQYAFRGKEGVTDFSPGLAGGIELGSGSTVGSWRFDGDFLVMAFRINFAADTVGGTNLVVNAPRPLLASVGQFAGNGSLFRQDTGGRFPVALVNAGGAGVRVYRAESPMVDIDPNVDMAAGSHVTALVVARA